MEWIHAAGAGLVVLLLFLVQRFFPRRGIFAIFCAVLLCAGAAFFITHKEKAEPMTAAERDHIVEQQMLVAEWHAEYQGLIEQMDHNWRQYHRILSDFSEDVIDREEYSGIMDYDSNYAPYTPKAYASAALFDNIMTDWYREAEANVLYVDGFEHLDLNELFGV